jgi:hypothetical protein
MISLALAALLRVSTPSSTELTIYNQGFGFVKEVRSLDLKLGRQTVSVEDVSALIDPTSVGIRSLTDKSSFNVLEQNYQYDLISPEAILNKSVGQRVRFIRTIGNARDVLEGVLLNSPTAIVAASDGGSQRTYSGMVIKTDDGRVVLDPTGEVEVEQVPVGLISKPTLMWDLVAQRSGANSVELSYITQGLKWDANYVMTLGAGNKADLQGWVTLDNQSGTTYSDAKLKLLAGDVNVAQTPRAFRGLGGGFGGKMAESAPQFQEQSLFEYHLYSLQRPATVRNKETKQISLLEAKDVPYTTKLVVDSMEGFSGFVPSEGEAGTGNIKPVVRLTFKNDQASNLGMPLPKGKFRIYQRDNEGSVQLLGENQIDHTPRNEQLSLIVGRAFDVVATRKRTNYKRISDHEFQESFEIEVRNRKVTPQTVYVLERHWGDWRILEKSHEFTKLDSEAIQFEVALQPNEVQTVKYTVDTKF